MQREALVEHDDGGAEASGIDIHVPPLGKSCLAPVIRHERLVISCVVNVRIERGVHKYQERVVAASVVVLRLAGQMLLHIRVVLGVHRGNSIETAVFQGPLVQRRLNRLAHHLV